MNYTLSTAIGAIAVCDIIAKKNNNNSQWP